MTRKANLWDRSVILASSSRLWQSLICGHTALHNNQEGWKNVIEMGEKFDGEVLATKTLGAVRIFVWLAACARHDFPALAAELS